MISYRTISSIFTFFNFLLLLIVVLSPNWFAYYANIDLYSIGLWTICSEKFGCRLMKNVDVYMNISRVFLMLGLVASVTSVLWMQVATRKKLFGFHFRFPPPALTASVLSFNAGFSMLVAMLIFETKINDEQSALARKKKWAFYLSYIIMILWFFIAQSFPGWAMILQDPFHPTYTGLWTICSEDECNYLSVREANLDFIRAFMLVALFSCFMAIICSTEWDYLINCSKDFFSEGPLAAIFSLITGINVLIAVIIFECSASAVVEPEVEVLSNKWAFFLSCATCVLCFATGIFSLVLYKCSLWKAPLPFCQVFPG